MPDKHDKRIHNIRLLLLNYRDMKRYGANAIFTLSQLKNNHDDNLDIQELLRQLPLNYTLGLDRIRHSKLRTHLLLQHVDSMLAIYKRECMNGTDCDQRRWKILEGVYVGKDVIRIRDFIARGIAKTTIYRDIDQICERLSVLLFGAEAPRVTPSAAAVLNKAPS